MESKSQENEKIIDVHSFLSEIELKFPSDVYEDFMNIMYLINSKRIRALDAIQNICSLFKGHPEVMKVFSKSLKYYKIEIHEDEIVQIIAPCAEIEGDDASVPSTSTVFAREPPTTIAPFNLQQSVKSYICNEKTRIPPAEHKSQSSEKVCVETMTDGTTVTLKADKAISYLDKVKDEFYLQTEIIDEFVRTMKRYRSLSLDIFGVIKCVCSLFRGHDELINDFNKLLPTGFKIDIQTNGQIQVITPGIMVKEVITSSLVFCHLATKETTPAELPK